MSADGGSVSARVSKGVESTGGTPDQQPNENDGVRRGDVVRIPHESKPSDREPAPFERSLNEDDVHLRWLRGEASKFFKAGRFGIFVLLPLVVVGFPLFWYALPFFMPALSNQNIFASISTRRLLLFAGIVSSAIGLMIGAGKALVREMSQTHSQMNRLDSKRTASRYVHDPATRARYVDNLLEVDKNEALSRDRLDASRHGHTSFLDFIRDVIRAFQDWRRGRQ